MGEPVIPLSILPDLPQLPQEQWPAEGDPGWLEAEQLAEWGYYYKCKAACALAKVPHAPGWMNAKTGLLAAELGAPVHQALWVVSMQSRPH